jgi:hypothetical protein
VFKVNWLIALCCLSFQGLAANVDPTKPFSASSPAGGSGLVKKGLVLETIIQGKKVNSAIISGKLMKVGDYIGTHKLVAVNRSSVVLRSDDERLRLSIFSGVVVK